MSPVDPQVPPAGEDMHIPEGSIQPFLLTLFVFILIANWLSVLPVQYTDSNGTIHELLKPPASDINFVLALSLFVFICYHLAGFWRRGVLGRKL